MTEELKKRKKRKQQEKYQKMILAVAGGVLVIAIVIILVVNGGRGGSQDVDGTIGNTSETGSENLTESESDSQKNESETGSATETESDSESEDEGQGAEEPKDPDMYSYESGYEVYDPLNTRGLDTTKYGYSYGVASGGQPHSQSISNQAFYDSLDNVDALALDTKSTEKVLYLTFDCGYEYDNNTAKILDILKEKNVKAAFFCTLDFLEDCPDTSARIINEGHILGNHSTTHPVFPDISRDKMASELYGVDKYLQDTYGYHTKYFRFPTGAYSENSLELCTSVGYRSVFWSVAYDDWDTSNQRGHDYAYDKVTSRLHPGAVILLHAVSSDNVSALGDIIDYARANGYTFVSLDEYPW